MYYVAHGSIPRQRHTQHRAPDGNLYAEELFGVEGFTGRSSLLYHLVPPTRTHRIEAVRRVALEAADDDLHRHRLTKTGGLTSSGDAISGRIPLYFNNDVVFGVVLPAESMPEGMF
jgi:homogentisate 1,2-dioxygenase